MPYTAFPIFLVNNKTKNKIKKDKKNMQSYRLFKILRFVTVVHTSILVSATLSRFNEDKPDKALASTMTLLSNSVSHLITIYDPK